MASGILGSGDLTANTNTTVYTVPADTYSVISVNFCNRSSSTANCRLSIGTGDTPGASDYLEYDISVGPNGVLERTGIVIDTSKKVVVRASVASVTAMVMGIETAVPAA